MLRRNKFKPTSEIAERIGDPRRFPINPAVLNDHAPLRDQVLETNRKFREGQLPAPRHHEGIGYVGLRIPEFDFHLLKLRFPDLNSKDHEIRHKAWQKFLRDPRSEQYKINKNEGRRRPSSAAHG